MAQNAINKLAPLDERQRYTIDEATAYLRQSRAKTYQDIAAGKLDSFTDGRRRYVPGTAIAARSRIEQAAYSNTKTRPR